MDVHPAQLALVDLCDVRRGDVPAARRGEGPAASRSTVDPALPAAIVTDEQRLQQCCATCCPTR